MKLRNLCLPLVLSVTATQAATWNGGGAGNNWGSPLNWDAAPINGDPLIFSGTTRQTNVNNSLTAIGALSFTSRGWNITGNDVTLGDNVTFLTSSGGAGDVLWGINTALTATRKIQVDNATGATLNITGLLSGAGGITRGAGGAADGTLRLSNTGNTFSGAVTLDGGNTEVVGLADTGIASSLGKGDTISIITLGGTSSNFAATLSFAGSGSTTTNRAISLSFRQDQSKQNLTNNSSGNGDLTFSSTDAVAMSNNNSTIDGLGKSTGILTFGGSSTGLTTFAGLLQDNPSDSNDILSIAKSGSGTLVLGNVNTYTGGTTVATGGTVRVTNSSSLGSGAVTVDFGGALALNGGISIANKLKLAGSTGTGALVSEAGDNTITGDIVLTNSTLIANVNAPAVSLTLAGTVDLGATELRLNGKNQPLAVTGKITGSGTKINVQSTTGNVTFSNNSSDFTAPIEAGFVRSLQFTSIGNVGAGPSALGAPSTVSEGTITFKNGNSFTRFEYIGTAAATTNRVLKMGGNNGALNLLNSGGNKITYTADLVRDSTSGGLLEFIPSPGSTIEFAGKISNGDSTTPLDLRVSSSGTTILGGANTYTGITTVSQFAELYVNGSQSGGGLITVSGLLSGSGTINGDVSVSGTGGIGSGASANTIGTLTVANVTLDAGGTLLAEVNSSAASSDKLAVTGTLTLNATSVLTVTDVAVSPVTLPLGTVLTIATAPSIIGTFGGLPEGATVSAGSNTFKISYPGSAVTLTTVASSPYDNYINSFTSLSGAQKDKTADPDGDGMSNLQEFALDGNPASGASSGKIQSSIATISGQRYLTLSIPVRNGATFTGSPLASAQVDGVAYTVLGSTDLVSFNQTVVEIAPALATTPALDPGWSYRSFRLAADITTQPRGFLRVQTTGPTP